MYIFKDGVYRISVRNMVEFVLRSGDIDSSVAGEVKKEEAMLLGGKIHRMIQKKMGSDYTPEVSLNCIMEAEGFVVSLEGRADGIIENDKGVAIDEIKGVYADIHEITEAKPVHMAQAVCYAYMYMLKKEELDEISVQVTYCNMDTLEIKRFVSLYSRQSITDEFVKMYSYLQKWFQADFEHRKRRNESIESLKFPFEYRPGQDRLVRDVYRVIRMKKDLFIEAPTGTGKTISVMYPAIMSMCRNLSDKIFYLTAKTITRTVARDTLNVLRRQAFVFRSVILTAKEKMCICEKPECTPQKCPYAKGHYDRINEAAFDVVRHEYDISSEVILDYANKHNVCPYELSLDISNWCDCVICDYNYVFDPNVYLRRYFGDGVKGEFVFLVDEAHNLVDRARQMYSAHLIKEDFLELKKLVKDKDKYLARLLDKCNREMLELKKQTQDYTVFASIGAFTTAVIKLYGYMEKSWETYKKWDIRDEIVSFYFKIRHFLNMSELLDDNYIIYGENLPDGSFMIKEFCVDPSANLSDRMSKANATVFFSATLLPITYYKELLGQSDDYAIYADSVFDSSKRALIIGSDITNVVSQRNVAQYHMIAHYIDTIVSAKCGNYFVFFSSYKHMQDVYDIFAILYNNKYNTIMQEQNMSEKAREGFLQEFKSANEKSTLGFMVLGGIFSEGIDMQGDSLIGTIIVGTGHPQVNSEGKLLRSFYDNKNGMGYDYAYTYPGMNKVLQAAGRLIRTEEDEGIIVLLDERFLTKRYMDTFPKEWNDYRISDIEHIGGLIDRFWKGKNGEQCEGNGTN